MAVKKTYCVAGHLFSLSLEEGDNTWDSLANYEPFVVSGTGEVLFSLELVQGFEMSGKRDLYLSKPETMEQRIDIYTVDGGYLFELAPFGHQDISGRMIVSGDFSTGRLTTVSDKVFCINNALMLLYAFRTAALDTIEIHASCVVNEGKGFLFLGKSGTGKSTHSRLWLKNIPGSRLLNDDNPVIRIVDGVPRVFGTPWSGKTPCYIARDFPVGAIVRINRAPHDAIHRMEVIDAFASLYSSSSGLRAIKSVADGLFATVSAVVEKVPSYLLDCLPDDNAAIVCSKEVIGHG